MGEREPFERPQEPRDQRLRHHDCRTAAIICAKSESPPRTFRQPSTNKEHRTQNSNEPCWTPLAFSFSFLSFYFNNSHLTSRQNLWSGGRAQKSYRLATHTVNSKIVQGVLSPAHAFLSHATLSSFNDLSTSIFSVSSLNVHSTKKHSFSPPSILTNYYPQMLKTMSLYVMINIQ